MARAAHAEQHAKHGGTAGRVAARRREGRPDKKHRARGQSPKGSGSRFARLAKLALLVGAFVCIGFFAVLVIDVGAGLIGSIKLGDTTLSMVWDKVVARVLDEDVPRAEAPARPRPPVRSASRPAPLEAARAPVKVASPEKDARHVDTRPRPDPEIERAKARLDEILGRL